MIPYIGFGESRRLHMVKNFKETALAFRIEWEETKKEFQEAGKAITFSQMKQRALLKRLGDILTTLKLLKEKDSTISLDGLDVPKELVVKIPPGSSIPDAMEAIIREFGPMKTREMIERLREFNVPISEKNPRIVIKNTMRRLKDRFALDEQKRITLVSMNHQKESTIQHVIKDPLLRPTRKIRLED
jgi:hypothetical protein